MTLRGMISLNNMFGLKRETDYAVLFLQFLGAKKKVFSSLREFSKKSGISFWFLQKIARKLNLGGIVETEQGVNGGYRLSRPLKNISLYKVFAVMEGEPAITPCARCADYSCVNYNKKCGVKKITEKLNKNIVKMLQNVKIAESV